MATDRAGRAAAGRGGVVGVRARALLGAAVAWLAVTAGGPITSVAAGPAVANADARPATSYRQATIGGCQMFPADNVWNARVDTLPVHPQSDAWVASIGASTGVKADFGSGLWEGSPIGIPYTTAPGSQPPVTISFEYDDESDPGPYRLPPDAPIEGGSDHHVLVVDRDRCLLTEVYASRKLSDTAWTAGSGAIFDLGSNALRPDRWTSADAAGLPILPGLARYDEVAAGEIAHALRFTAPRTQRAYLWPARHFASDLTDPALPPMGARFRLKASVDVSGYHPQARVVLTALQRYGMFLADNGSPWFVSGVPDERWDNDALRQLRFVLGSQLEAVDESSLMMHPDSGQIRTTPVPAVPCDPRPPAAVTVTRGGPDRLDVTVAAGREGGAANNSLRALRFGAFRNATVQVGSQGVSGSSRIGLPAGTREARLAVARQRPDEAVTVPLVVEDACGDWPTFVGGGRAAF